MSKITERLIARIWSEHGVCVLEADRPRKGSGVMSFFKVRNMVTNEVRMARYSTDYAASSYGIPALVLDDGQVADELWWGLELEEPVEEAHRGVAHVGAFPYRPGGDRRF